MKQQPMVYHFSTEELPELSEVGGKGLALIRMSQAGFPVPAGFVLTGAFFRPWFVKLQRSDLWTAVLDSPAPGRQAACLAAQNSVADYEFSPAQCAVLSSATQALHAGGAGLFAVRSSSPEEDLEGASFAGGYETTLGVPPANLQDAIRRSFASCLAERVFIYKEEHGFDLTRPRIAIVVQEQIAADAAGVAFSLNPLNNCYDEVVINANAGLGESVVSGAVTPDTFIIDKVARRIIGRDIGGKETAVFLVPTGGTITRAGGDERPSLSDDLALRIAELTAEVEAVYGKAVDIEWALTGDQLYLLQARPITAYFPLPPIMLTPPGARKNLYADKTLLKQGISELLTVMGTDFLALADAALSEFTGGVAAAADIHTGLGLTFDGRMYLNVSNNMKLQGHNRIVREYRSMDALAADILAHIDRETYIPAELPEPLKGLLWKAMWRNIPPLLKSVKAFRRPADYKADVEAAVITMRRRLQQELETASSFRTLANAILNHYLAYMDAAMASLLVSELARLRMKRLLKDEQGAVRQKAVYLERGLPENITIEMGLAMYRLAQFPEIMACACGDDFARRLRKDNFSSEFLAAWREFMAAYGGRCPRELDLGTPRYDEQPAQFFTQLRALAENNDPENDPQRIFARAQAEREAMFQELYARLAKRGRRKAKLFRKQYNHLVAFGGMRESHKYHIIWIMNLYRKKVLAAAEKLVEKGRLDSAQQVFDLTIDQLDRALTDTALDLRALAYGNTDYQRRWAHVRHFPRIFDSRGRILRPPQRPTADGELAGQPISPGVVRGKVKVLHAPGEKEILPGDILVARATDPGWTPLFANAAAILLEVGGLLQHGSLVAREYGKPCVAGIENVTGRLRDGQMVEVDGLQGVVRLLDGRTSSDQELENSLVKAAS